MAFQVQPWWLDPKGQIFTHVDPESRAVLHIYASEMWRYIVWEVAETGRFPEGVEGMTVVLDPEFVSWAEDHRGIDRSYAASLTQAELCRPVLGIHMPDGSTLTVDGHHRMAALALWGATEYKLLRFSWAAAEPFRLALPPTLSAMLVADVQGTAPHGPH